MTIQRTQATDSTHSPRDDHVCLTEEKEWRPCPSNLCEGLALLQAVEKARDLMERMQRDLWQLADENDDDGGHVGFSSYYRNVARGIGDAQMALDGALRREVLGPE